MRAGANWQKAPASYSSLWLCSASDSCFSSPTKFNCFWQSIWGYGCCVSLPTTLPILLLPTTTTMMPFYTTSWFPRNCDASASPFNNGRLRALTTKTTVGDERKFRWISFIGTRCYVNRVTIVAPVMEWRTGNSPIRGVQFLAYAHLGCHLKSKQSEARLRSVEIRLHAKTFWILTCQFLRGILYFVQTALV